MTEAEPMDEGRKWVTLYFTSAERYSMVVSDEDLKRLLRKVESPDFENGAFIYLDDGRVRTYISPRHVLKIDVRPYVEPEPVEPIPFRDGAEEVETTDPRILESLCRE